MVKLKPITSTSWLVLTNDGLSKVGLLTKSHSDYILLARATKAKFKNRAEINAFFQEDIFANLVEREELIEAKEYFIKGYPVDFDNPCEIETPVDVEHDLPLYSKTETSSVYYCAGFYCISFPKGWISSYCPKYSTLAKYGYEGPFKSEEDRNHKMKQLKAEYVRDKKI